MVHRASAPISKDTGIRVIEQHLFFTDKTLIFDKGFEEEALSVEYESLVFG